MASHSRKPPEAPEAAAATAAEQNGNGNQELQHPGVVVFRVPGEKMGEEQIQIMEINGLDPLAVPTLLGVARKIKSAQLGLD